MRWIYVTLTILVFYAGCEVPPATPTEPSVSQVSPVVPEQVENVDRLTGIAQVHINPDGSVTLVSEESTGEGIHLKMYDDSGRVVNEQTLQVGQDVLLSDDRYVAIWYTLTDVEAGRAIFQVTGRFDARPFGGEVNTYRKVVAVRAYP